MALHWLWLRKNKPSAKARKMLHGICLATIATGIGYLCEESAEEFCRRSNALELFNERISPDDIKEFYGLRTNVNMETSSEWARKHMVKREAGSAWAKRVQALAYSPENQTRANEINQKEAKNG